MECVKYVLVFSQFRSANFEIKTKLNIPFHHTPHQKMGKQTFKNYAMEIEQQQQQKTDYFVFRMWNVDIIF